MRAPRLLLLTMALLVLGASAAAAHDTGPTALDGDWPAASPTAQDEGGIGTASHGPEARFTYEVGTAGSVSADEDAFARRAARTLTDDRGWSLGGSVELREVDSGGDFELLLASPAAVERAAEVCSRSYSCRVGDRVYINDRNWREATSAWRGAGGDLETYRDYVVNHEVGHFLGFSHASCPGTGRPAPVMQQQSISLEGCEPTGWPSDGERATLASRLGVEVRDLDHPDPGAAPEHTWLAADLTGDGDDEVVGFSRETGEWTVGVREGDGLALSVWNRFATASGWATHEAADVDGDGDEEILSYHPGTGQWWGRGPGGGGLPPRRWVRYATAEGWADHVVGDFTGDGADEVASYHPANGTWWVTAHDGGSPTTERWARFSTRRGWQEHLVGDLDGDGDDDLASYHGRGVWWVSASTGAGFDGDDWATYSPGRGWGPHRLADADGDGRDDIVSYHQASGGWWLGTSTGTSLRTSRWTTYGTAEGWAAHRLVGMDDPDAPGLLSQHGGNGTWWWSARPGDEPTRVGEFSPASGWQHLQLRVGGGTELASLHPSNGVWWRSTMADGRLRTQRAGQLP